MPLTFPLRVKVPQRERPLGNRPPTRLLFAIALLCILLLAWWANASLPVLGSLSAVALGFVLWLLRSDGRLRFLGPLFFYDLARLARRGRTTLLRCSYAAVLLGWLCVMVADRFPGFLGQAFQAPSMSIRDWAEFARGFGMVLLSLQAGAVLVLTPAYLAGAFTEEKERRTLDLLFTSELYDRELVLGKLFGRLLHLATILLAALPIFALARLWGGIDDDMLLAGFAVAALTMFSIGSVSLLCSVIARTMLGALVCSYAVVLALNLFCLAVPVTSPLLFVPAWDRQVAEEWRDWQEMVSPGASPATAVVPPPNPTRILAGMLIPYVIVHGLLGVVCAAVAIRLLRDVCLAPGEVLVRGMLLEGKVVLPWGSPAWPARERGWRPPTVAFRSNPVGEPPLLWKEMSHGIAAVPGPSLREWLAISWRQVLTLLAGLAAASLLCTFAVPDFWLPALSGVNVLVRFVSVVLSGVWCLLVAFRAAGCISRERDQRTLDSLLVLPGDREEILRAKWLGGILRYRQLGYALLVAWVLALAVGALHPAGFLLLAAACGVQLAFLASLGLWLSLNARNTLWANMAMSLVSLVLFLGPWLGLPFGQPYYGAMEGGWLHRLLLVPFSPGYGWWFAAFSWQDLAAAVRSADAYSRRALVQIVAGLPLFGAAAWGFWWLSCRRFRLPPARPLSRVPA